MAGGILRTHLMLIEGDRVILHETTLLDIAIHYGVMVDNQGFVTLRGKPVGPSYCMKQWTKQEVLKDWVKYHLHKHSPTDYKIIRVLTN